MRIIEYKGKKYEIDREYCDNCKADAGFNYCMETCDYLMNRLTVEKEWHCKACGSKNIDTDILLEDEYGICKNCNASNVVDIVDGVVVSVDLED